MTGGGGGVELTPIIQPITDMDQLLRLVSVVRDTPTTAATGALTVHTVPAGQRWRVYFVSFDRISGDAVSTNMSLLDSSTGLACVVARYGATGSTTQQGYPWFPMDEGDSLRMYISSVSTSSQFEVTMLIEYEEAF